MALTLMIVESPSKAKTIQRYIGSDYKVLASYGHVRDLKPKKGAVTLHSDHVEMKYELVKKNLEQVQKLIKEAKGAQEILLATDPDREGEAIAFHLKTIFQEEKTLKNISVKRVVFYEISKNAILEALEHKRELDDHLVNAQQARRALDYLVGFGLSPVLWKKVKTGLSAGRVQSPALRMIADREKEIADFVSKEYWTLETELQEKKQSILAKLTHIRDKKVQQFDFTDKKSIDALMGQIDFHAQERWDVLNIEEKSRKRSPVPPFTTSTLQQEASRKLGFSSSQTMKIAQQLYEGVDIGTETTALITYMRTDSVSLSQDAIENIRQVIASQFPESFLPSSPRYYKNKSKNAQEAHEAVRPIHPSLSPEVLKSSLSAEQYKLYKLIWARTISSQMSDALYQDQILTILAGEDYRFESRRTLLKKEGFLALYQEGQDDQEEELAGKKFLDLAVGQRLGFKKWHPSQHFTEAPPRYNEASLVKALDAHGIGRPSTYASIISTLKTRGYVELRQKRFYPTDIGVVVNDFLKKFFSTYVDYDFTAQMEDKLDDIASGSLEWDALVRTFADPFHQLIGHITDKISKKEAVDELLDENCPQCGHQLMKKLGRSGRFIGCSHYPECRYARPVEGSAEAEQSPAIDKNCPECEKPLMTRRGRFGLFVGCSGYPECTYIESKKKNIETGISCPACHQGQIVGKKSRKGSLFYACNRYPDCKELYGAEPIAQPCPSCHYPVLLKKDLKRTGQWLVCSKKECGYKESLGFASDCEKSES